MSRVARSARASTSSMKRRPVPSSRLPAGAAQAFFEHGAGHARVRPGQQPGRVELHHFHVAQRQTRRRAPAPGRRSSCRRKGCGTGTWSVRRRWPATPPGPGRGQIRRVRMSMISAPAIAAPSPLLISACTRCSSSRSMPRAQTCLGEPVDDLDAGQVALVHRAVEGLPGEGLLMDGAVGVAVEEAAELVFQFAHPLDRAGHQRPGEILVGQPVAALDRVHEVPLDGVARSQRDVVAALDHARTAALAEQALDRHGDRPASGSAWCACSAANSPAPPAPRIRMSVCSRRMASAPSSVLHAERGQAAARRASRRASTPL